MTTTRRPVLPKLHATVVWLKWRDARGMDVDSSSADAELRAAEAVIRAARASLPQRWDARRGRWVPDPGWEKVHRALARLDKLTRPTRRTP